MLSSRSRRERPLPHAGGTLECQQEQPSLLFPAVPRRRRVALARQFPQRFGVPRQEAQRLRQCLRVFRRDPFSCPLTLQNRARLTLRTQPSQSAGPCPSPRTFSTESRSEKAACFAGAPAGHVAQTPEARHRLFRLSPHEDHVLEPPLRGLLHQRRALGSGPHQHELHTRSTQQFRRLE